MEPFIGALTSTETSTTTTIITAVTSTTATTSTSQINGSLQVGDDDSNFDRLTQMLPECFVSVKLENSEDTCATEACTNTVPSVQHPSPQDMSSECAPETSPSLSEMQNSSQTSLTASATGNRIAPSVHRFHHRGSIPELPPWLQHCYTSAQMPNSDGTQQASQYFHQSTAYLTDGSIVQSDRSIKSNAGVARFDAAPSSGGIGGLSSGDICDSNTFLTYVLNQQRSTGIFLFDPIRSLHPESASDAVQHQNENDTNSNCVNQKNSSDTSAKNSMQPSSIPPIEGNPTHRDAATNTISKYSQTVSPVQLHADAKTNTGEYSDDSDTPSTPKQCHLHHSKKCVVSKVTHVCCGSSEQNISGEFMVDGTCHKVSNTKNFSSTGCVNHKPETKLENGKVDTNFVVVSTTGCSQQDSHKPCICLSDNTHVGHTTKAENISSNSLNNEDTNGKFNNVQLGHSIECKCTSDCDNTCIKDNQRVQYVDIDRPFTCEICLKNYHTSTALMNHMRYHRGQRPYQCEVCNKAFATNSHLVTHRRVHTGERPFQCRLCRRSFADRSAYVKHERTHGPNGTIIKRYKCEECGNAFVDSCGLKKHIRIHTGERPYCCSVCQKTFSTSSTFVAHKRIHSGERPYKCENCDKMFITKSHLLTHRRTHTGEKPFSCQVCNRAFADGSSFRRHERLHTVPQVITNTLFQLAIETTECMLQRGQKGDNQNEPDQ